MFDQNKNENEQFLRYDPVKCDNTFHVQYSKYTPFYRTNPLRFYLWKIRSTWKKPTKENLKPVRIVKRDRINDIFVSF